MRKLVKALLCPARNIEEMGLPSTLKAPVLASRLLVLSPFKQTTRRTTAKLADECNGFVVALANEVFVAFKSEGYKTEQLCRDLISAGRPVLTFDAPSNGRLIAMGSTPVTMAALAVRWIEKGRMQQRQS